MDQLRIVLIGGRQLGGTEASGKSSVGNTILGSAVFDTGRRTARCQKADVNAHGYEITVVDTPGWWWHYSVENTPMFDRFEIIRSPSLCPPGPHVFLLVIPMDSVFPQIYRIALEEHLELFGKHIWKHMIVVFSSVTSSDVRALEKHVNLWPDLQWILRKCKNRYHILEIKKQDKSTQVPLLLSKIANLVAEENGEHFVINTNVSLQLDKRMRQTEERTEKLLSGQRQEAGEDTRRLDDTCPADLRLVIVGASWDGRSSTGNLILGTQAFDVDEARTTVQCVVKSNTILGRQLTVVDTPGWFYHNPLEKTSERDKLQIKGSVTLCPPGPHAILLTVPTATAFNESYQKAVEEHMGLFGEEIWARTIVLFTRGDWLGDTTMAERLGTEEGRLEWLMNKCGNRYHVITCKDPSDFTQTTKIIQKIDEMVEGNGGSYHETDHSLYSELSVKLEVIKTTAQTNKIKARKQRNILQKVFIDQNNVTELRIELLGGERSGKSNSGNTILFNHVFQETLTENFQDPKSTKQCVMHQRKIDGCLVSVVDTPGWSISTLENSKEILQSISACPPGPHAFLMVLSARQSFTKKDQQALEAVMKCLGERAWRHVLLLFSHGDWLRDKPIEEHIECEGEPLKWLVRKCENRYHVLDNRNWGDGSQVKHLLEKIKEMVVRNRGDYFTLEKASRLQEWFFRAKTLTEEECNKREDDLIRRMLEAVWLDSDVEDPTSPVKMRIGSMTFTIPNMRSETMSETGSLWDSCHVRSNVKVSQWLRHNAPSSGYDTASVSNTEMSVTRLDEEATVAHGLTEDSLAAEPNLKQDSDGIIKCLPLGHARVKNQPRRNSV
ncbi:uncharacterized protein LOC143482425 isoform X2 [Brachyhypopomus gauderio]